MCIRDSSDEAVVYEGSISSDSLQEVLNAIGEKELLQLSQEKIPAHLMAPSLDVLDVRIRRITQWQQLRFPDQESRKPFYKALEPLLEWLDTLPTKDRTAISENEGKNNCLPPHSEDVQLTRREETAVPASVESPPHPTSSYMLRILMDQLDPGEVRRTCAIIYPNGFYHLEKSRQRHYVGGVYQPDTVQQSRSGKIKADVFELSLIHISVGSKRVVRNFSPRATSMLSSLYPMSWRRSLCKTRNSSTISCSRPVPLSLIHI